jgi:hypothetical protein
VFGAMPGAFGVVPVGVFGVGAGGAVAADATVTTLVGAGVGGGGGACMLIVAVIQYLSTRLAGVTH